MNNNRNRKGSKNILENKGQMRQINGEGNLMMEMGSSTNYHQLYIVLKNIVVVTCNEKWK